MQQSVGAPGSPLGGGLLGRLAAGRSGRLGRRLHNATHTDPLANSSSSAGRTSRPWADLDLQLQQLPQDLLNPLGTSIRQAQSGAGAAGAGSSDPCGQFTVVVVTASRATAQRVEEVLRPVMREAGEAGQGLCALRISISTSRKEFKNFIMRWALPSWHLSCISHCDRVPSQRHHSCGRAVIVCMLTMRFPPHAQAWSRPTRP